MLTTTRWENGPNPVFMEKCETISVCMSVLCWTCSLLLLDLNSYFQTEMLNFVDDMMS